MILLTAICTALAGPLPPPDFPHGVADSGEPEPTFGADISVGYAHGSMSAPWIEQGGHGAALIRYEAFARNRHAQGPRIGASLWASQTFGKTAIATEPVENGGVQEIEVDMSHYGLLAVLRYPPTAPIGATMGFGFGRAEIQDYWGGPLTLPVLTFEAGARHRVGKHGFVDWMGRTHWATSRSAIDSQLDEWWIVELAVLFGYHAN